MQNLDSLLDFFLETEQLKQTRRYSTCPAVSDSVADHSWKLAFMVSTLSKDIPEIDPLHTIEMCLVHDLAEYVTGEIDAHRIYTGEVTEEEKYALELKAVEEFKGRLAFGQKIYDLWTEFEEQQTPEAKYARALDKIEALIHIFFEGVEKDNDPDFTISYANDVIENAPKLKPLLKRIKQRLKTAYQDAGIEWKPEYEAFP